MDITAAEAARRLGITRQAAVKWARSGKIGGSWQTETGREWRIPEESVEKLRRERESIKV
jgi:excisionase family DNA binding protein